MPLRGSSMESYRHQSEAGTDRPLQGGVDRQLVPGRLWVLPPAPIPHSHESPGSTPTEMLSLSLSLLRPTLPLFSRLRTRTPGATVTQVPQ